MNKNTGRHRPKSSIRRELFVKGMLDGLGALAFFWPAAPRPRCYGMNAIERDWRMVGDGIRAALQHAKHAG
ncbi:MAG: hypothetical protein MUE49_12705 [Rhodospirillales bacterium]|jgi:hypothetical protein|nr:hypothetical protein [Rhodospirillales bacterium]